MIIKSSKNNLILFLLVMIIFSLASCQLQQKKHLLIEAESFDEKGGWLVDPQFVEQMGSPYLLAHGMGNPVKNAKTVVNFTPESGAQFDRIFQREDKKG